MKKLYIGRIWVIILLSIIASQNTFATQTIQGIWERTSLRNNLYSILSDNQRADIEESQYAFTLTEEAQVNIKQTNDGDGFLFLFSVNNSGKIEVVKQYDGGGEYINGKYVDTVIISETLSSGNYFIVPSTFDSHIFDPPQAFTLEIEITFVSNSNNSTVEVGLVNADGSIPNEATQFSGDTSASGNEDSTITGTLIALDVEGLSGDNFAITVNPSDGTATIDKDSGFWEYTPSTNSFGEYTFTVTVTDDVGATTEQIITAIVDPVDDATEFSGNTSGTGDEDNIVSGTLIALDVEGLSGDNFAITVNPSDGTATIDKDSGDWQYTPIANDFGEYTFTVTVTDDRGGTDFQVINISINAVNDAPIITSNGITTAIENQLYSYTVFTGDVEDDAVSLSASSIPDWLNFDTSTGVLSGTPAHIHAQMGAHTVVIRADDGTDTVEQSFTIAVEDVNNLPTINLNVNNFIEDAGGLVAGESVAASYQTADLDGDELTVTFADGSNSNNHYSLDTTEQKILLTQVGIDNINRGDPLDLISLNVIEVQTNQSSSSGGSSSQPTDPEMPDIPIEDPFDEVSSSPTDNDDSSAVSATATPGVTAVNDAPLAIPKTGDNAVNAVEQIETTAITLQGTDQDGDATMIFAINSLPTHGKLQDDLGEIQASQLPKNVTGTLTYTSDSDTATSDSFTFKANDGELYSVDAATVTITITPVNDLPVGAVTISGIVAKGQNLIANNTLADADGIGVISYQWQADDEDIIGANQNTYQLTQNDLNKKIAVIASYIDDMGTKESVESNTSTQILNAALHQLTIDSANNTSELYMSAGILGVTEENIASINDAILTVGVITQSQVQQLVDSYIKILDFAANNSSDTDPPDYNNFIDIGILDITEDSNSVALALLNDVISSGNTEAIDSISELQSLTKPVFALIDQAENATDVLSKSHLELLGVEAVTDSNLADIRQIIADADEDLDRLVKIQLLVNKVIASHTIRAYRNNIVDNAVPSLVDYYNLGLTNINSNNIHAINSAIVTIDPSAFDSVVKIVGLLTTDSDLDEVIDLIDSFPQDPQEVADKDADTVGDNADNCPNVPNINQLDNERDGIGDACDPDEDGDGVASADDAFKLNAAYSKDTDGDGMPDAFETKYGFDLNNSADRDTDSDGDNVTNIDEFLAGTDPRLNPMPGLPELFIPNDIVIVSTGRLTAVDIGEATALDSSQAKLQPVANFSGPFGAGRHEVLWVATDSQGNQSKAVQVVKVLPLVNLTPSSLIAEGGIVDVRAVLSGDAADYPVEIPYTVKGTATNEIDYQIIQNNGLIKIDQGREASFRIEVVVDNEIENDEFIEITLGQPTNAVLGSVTERKIIIVDGNLPPQINVQVMQGDNLGRIIVADKGEVVITASVSDPNPEDTHQFDWQIETDQLSAVIHDDLQENNKVLVIDPSQLEPGIFSITAKAVDSSEAAAITRVKTDFRLLEFAPKLSNEIDSDGDGTSDAEEGYADSDSDGIVDYMDNIEESNLAPVSESSDVVLQAPVGTQLVLGEMAFANAKNSVLVSKEKVIQIISERQLQTDEGMDDKDYDYPTGLYDFTISGAIPGRSYYLVIPLPLSIENGQVFRKYMGSKIGWQNFVENAKNTLFSAKATDGACPEPASRLYDYGLLEGNNCIQIYIEDGGPNDADGKVDGVVTDPAGIAVFNRSIIKVEAPSSDLSNIKLSKSVIYIKGDTSTITISALNNDGKPLDAVDISAKCIFCLGVDIGQFTQFGKGVYKASITSGRQISFGYIEAELTNEFGSAKLEPQKLNVIYRPTGGCTVAANGRTDISLFIMLILLSLYHYRKKPLT